MSKKSATKAKAAATMFGGAGMKAKKPTAKEKQAKQNRSVAIGRGLISRM